MWVNWGITYREGFKKAWGRMVGGCLVAKKERGSSHPREFLGEKMESPSHVETVQIFGEVKLELPLHEKRPEALATMISVETGERHWTKWSKGIGVTQTSREIWKKKGKKRRRSS